MRLIDADALRLEFEFSGSDIIAKETIDNALTIDAVPVVRCKDCISHGVCLTEDAFRIARIENPYCCGGKRKGNNT